MKDFTILRLVLPDGSSKIHRANRSGQPISYVLLRKINAGDKLEFKEVKRDLVKQDDENNLGVFHVHPSPSPIYFEAFHCRNVTISRGGTDPRKDPYKPINQSPGSFVLFDDDERPIVLHIGDYCTIHFERRQQLSQIEDRRDIGILVENTDLQEPSEATPRPAHIPGELGGTIVGRDIQVSRSTEDYDSDATKDLGSEAENEDLLVKETQEEMVPSTDEHKLFVVAQPKRSLSRTPQPLLSTIDDQAGINDIGMDDAEAEQEISGANVDVDMPDSLPPAFAKVPKQQTPRRTYKDRNRRKVIDTPEKTEPEEGNTEPEQEVDDSPVEPRSTRNARSTNLRGKRTRLNKEEHVQEEAAEQVEEAVAEENVPAPEALPEQDAPEEQNTRTIKRRRIATKKGKAVTDEKGVTEPEPEVEVEKSKTGSVARRKRKELDSISKEASPADSNSSTPLKSMDPPRSQKGETVAKTRSTRGASVALSSQGHTPQKTFTERLDDGNTPRTTKTFLGDVKSLKIIFSNSKLEDAKETLAFLRSKKIKVVKNVMDKDVRILVVGTGEIKKTSKLLLSITMGKIIVDDQWLVDCQKAGEILDTEPYCPSDPTRESEWNIKLSEILQQDSNSVDRNLKIFEDKSVYFTPAVKKHLQNASSFDDFKNMITITGGSILTKAPKELVAEDSCIVISMDGDKENKKYAEAGKQIYKTDLITFSVLRNHLDLDNKEYILQP